MLAKHQTSPETWNSPKHFGKKRREDNATRNWDPKFRRAQQSRTNSCLRSSLGGSMIGGLPRMKCYECYECWDKIQIIYHYVLDPLVDLHWFNHCRFVFPIPTWLEASFLGSDDFQAHHRRATPSRPVHRASSCWLVTVTVCLFDIKDIQRSSKHIHFTSEVHLDPATCQ